MTVLNTMSYPFTKVSMLCFYICLGPHRTFATICCLHGIHSGNINGPDLDPSIQVHAHLTRLGPQNRLQVHRPFNLRVHLPITQRIQRHPAYGAADPDFVADADEASH